MKKYRVAGVIEERIYDSSNPKKFSFTFNPDSEFVSSFRDKDKTTRFMVFQPIDSGCDGLVVKYEGSIIITYEGMINPRCHIVFEVEGVKKGTSKNADLVFDFDNSKQLKFKCSKYIVK